MHFNYRHVREWGYGGEEREGQRTWGIGSTRRAEVCWSLRSVRLWTLESLTLEPERRADAPLEASSAG
jgi:hypothetical protein